jgi:predicted nucleic acid-binding protein
MKLLDTNIIIYASSPNYAHLLPLVQDPDNAYSHISYVETLGFQQLSTSEFNYYNSILMLLHPLPVSFLVIQRAAELKRNYKIKLGDSLIAATALVHNLPIYTRNEADFKKIAGITVVNPV